jgi:hypothetical protein
MKRCDNCASPAPTTQQDGDFIDYGWSIDWLSLGHYGGFTDCLPDSQDDEPNRYIAHLCHDCCLKMLDAMPGLAALIFPQGGGGHPNMNEHDSDNGTATPPCCPYAWTWNKTVSPDGEPVYETYFGTADGGWKKISD